jgi:non-specific serine/threonine protein kinase/serine/threonine-protein kinase PknK
VLTEVVARCSQAGLVRFLADGGEHVMDTLQHIVDTDHPPTLPPQSSDVPRDFLLAALAADAGLT